MVVAHLGWVIWEVVEAFQVEGVDPSGEQGEGEQEAGRWSGLGVTCQDVEEAEVAIWVVAVEEGVVAAGLVGH